MITNIKDVIYDKKYFWDVSLNPNATIKNALPNCTTCAYGLIIAEGKLPPVSDIVGAGSWDKYLSNGWMSVDYDSELIEVGDIIQWIDKGHVAAISKIDGDKKIVSASFYTGEHGKSIYEGNYDTRKSFTSLKQLSDFMLEKYPNRYFHVWNVGEECRWVGGLPNKILKHPLYSVKRNINKDQIEVLTFEQNVRDNDNNILKKAEKGYYDVLSTIEKNGYLWYEVEDNKYIAQVDGRVVFLPREDSESLIEENKRLKKENEDLKERLRKIEELSKI